MNVDAVRAEFQGLLRQTEAANERAATALDAVLRQNFADGEGRLPRTLERFLGDKGQLQGFVDDLFDEAKRDSAIGRMKVLLGTYFDGDASRLAQLLDPTRLGSPLHQFRSEMAEGFKVIARSWPPSRRPEQPGRRSAPNRPRKAGISRASSRPCSAPWRAARATSWSEPALRPVP